MFKISLFCFLILKIKSRFVYCHGLSMFVVTVEVFKLDISLQLFTWDIKFRIELILLVIYNSDKC